MRRITIAAAAVLAVVCLPVQAQDGKKLFNECYRQHTKEKLAYLLIYPPESFSRLADAYVDKSRWLSLMLGMVELNRPMFNADQIEDLQDCVDQATWYKRLRKLKRREDLRVDLLEEFIADYKAATAQ